MRLKHGCSGRNSTDILRKIYHAWRAMRQRCENPKNPNYKNYGARGIKVCKRWNSFINFLDDMGKPPSQKHTIERINNDGNYTPSNCRWATYAEQNRNHSRNVILEYEGQRLCVKDWAKKLNIPYRTLEARIRRGWLPKKALEKVVQKRQRNFTKIEYHGEIKSLTEWCGILNLHRDAMEARIRRGMISEQAFEKPVGRYKRRQK